MVLEIVLMQSEQGAAMTPTNKLRWLNKFSYNDGYTPVLQQWWANDPDCYEDWVLKVNGEWRDVEVVNEQT